MPLQPLIFLLSFQLRISPREPVLSAVEGNLLSAPFHRRRGKAGLAPAGRSQRLSSRSAADDLLVNHPHYTACAIIRFNFPSPKGSCATREIDLETAVSEIKQACDESPDGKPPFFIIAGAGVSMPSVPLASEIAQECKAIAVKNNRATEPTSKLPLDVYSHWFERAFPQASQRQRYFKKLIENKPISHANFRLAHLLSERKLATLVVTPNFDDFLSRALALFGQPHTVCDHPNTVERIDPESPEIQIVHVHGSYWFYDCCNLRGEIEARTEDSRDRAVTMASLLGNILSRRSAIVVGYAGWEGDVIMTALMRRLKSGLPNNLYWYCFRRSGLDSLRLLLKNHRDVCLVLPPPSPIKPETDWQPTSGDEAGCHSRRI